MKKYIDRLAIKLVVQHYKSISNYVEKQNYETYLKYECITRPKVQSKVIQSVQNHPIQCDLYQTNTQTKNLIIFIHGYVARKSEFFKMINEPLLNNFDLLLYNLYGEKNFKGRQPIYTYGKLEQIDLHTIINLYPQYENIYLVGHSLGGITILNYLNDYNNARVKKYFTFGIYEKFDQAIKRTANQFTNLLPRNIYVDTEVISDFYQQTYGFTPQDFSPEKVINQNGEKVINVFGQNDSRAPLFITNAATYMLKDCGHEEMFLKYSNAISKIIVNEIENSQ